MARLTKTETAMARFYCGGKRERDYLKVEHLFMARSAGPVLKRLERKGILERMFDGDYHCRIGRSR